MGGGAYQELPEAAVKDALVLVGLLVLAIAVLFAAMTHSEELVAILVFGEIMIVGMGVLWICGSAR